MPLSRPPTLLLCCVIAALCIIDATSATQSCPSFTLQRQLLGVTGKRAWHKESTIVAWNPKQTALFVIDVRDRHWCLAEDVKLRALAAKINAAVEIARDLGVTVMHGPSECMRFYAKHPARKRVVSAPQRETPTRDFVPLPKFPYDTHTTHQCATNQRPSGVKASVPWSRQHPLIFVDKDDDGIVDPTNGQEVYSYLRSRNIKHVLFAGHATNINVLRKHASSLLQVSTWGFEVTLLRDLTEPMVNPYRPPFHSEEETMTHAVNYVERFLGHSASMFDLTEAAPGSGSTASMGTRDYDSPYQQVLRWDRHVPLRNS